MNIISKSILAAALCATVLAGCSSGSGSGSSAFTEYVRVADLAPQTATISIADPGGTPVATITSQPADIALTVTATGVSATNVTFSLTATNNTPRILFGAKIVVDTISDADATTAPTSTATGTTFGGDIFASLGFAAIDMGSTADTTDDISITDADDLDDPLVITVTLPTSEYVAYGSSGSSGGYEEYEIQDINGDIEDSSLADFTNYTPPGGGSILDSIISPDGRYVYSGGRNTTSLMRLDTVTLQTSGVRLSSSDFANVGGIKATSDFQYIYAGYTENSHRYSTGGDAAGTPSTHVAKIDLASMTVVSTIRLPSILAAYYRGGVKSVGISGDDTTLAVSTWDDNSGNNGQVHIVDISSNEMTIVGDPIVAKQPRVMTLNDDGTTLYYGSKDDASKVDVVDLATRVASTLTLTNTSTNTPLYLDFGPDGRLYYLRETSFNGLAIFDLSVSTTDVVVDTLFTPCGLDFYKGGGLYFICESNGTSIWDINDDTMIQADSGGSGFDEHAFTVSPY